MKKKNRRKFLVEIGMSVGALALGKGIVRSLPSIIFREKKERIVPVVPPPSPPPKDVVDFRYAPAFWQSTYCFPDDPYKSLVGKNGALLYGHSGLGGDANFFPQVVVVGLSDAG